MSFESSLEISRDNITTVSIFFFTTERGAADAAGAGYAC